MSILDITLVAHQCPSMGAMNISLTDDLDNFVRDAVRQGQYLSSSEVVRDALRMLRQQQEERALRLARLRADIAEGLASGPSEPLDMEAIKAKARATLS